MSWTWSHFHCHLTSLTCHVAKMDPFIPLCRTHLWLEKEKEQEREQKDIKSVEVRSGLKKRIGQKERKTERREEKGKNEIAR